MTAMVPSFFLPGDAQDVAYLNTRDHPRGNESRAFCEALWVHYRALADPHFREDARNHFLQRFWEMYLAVTLLERGLRVERYGDEGPEFFVLVGGRRLWIEAVAPGSGEGPDRVPEIVYGGNFVEIPVEKILLRFTNALTEKRNRYLAALSKGIIAPEDMYLLALNSRGIPYAPYESSMPYFLQAFLPIGPLTAEFDVKTGEMTDSFYGYRPVVRKLKGAEVSTRTFLDPEEGSFCSAIVHSAVDCANHPITLGDDFSILHNSGAVNPVDSSVFFWCKQFFVRDNQLQREEPNSGASDRSLRAPAELKR
jgi:hypothetical protein